MRFSYSRVGAFKSCKYLYKLRYIDGLKTLTNYDDDNALLLGSTIHLALEKGIDDAKEFYFNSFPIATDNQINEFMKIEFLYNKIHLPYGEMEVKIEDENFIGFIDRLVEIDDNNLDIYDYKYSNNIINYLKSSQLHIYKYFFEKITGKNIRNLYYVFIPKVAIRQKKDEDIFKFRKRLQEELDTKDVTISQVKYDKQKVDDFIEDIEVIKQTKVFPKCQSRLCDWCEFKNYCIKGETWELIERS